MTTNDYEKPVLILFDSDAQIVRGSSITPEPELCEGLIDPEDF